jgi:hypothetical protein
VVTKVASGSPLSGWEITLISHPSPTQRTGNLVNGRSGRTTATMIRNMRGTTSAVSESGRPNWAGQRCHFTRP